jgi:hypothetical protein
MESDLICSICYECIGSPFMHSECRQQFCIDCILPIFVHSRSPKCPKCRLQLDRAAFPCAVPAYVDPDAESKLRNTYACPFCSDAEYSRVELTSHIDALHEGLSALCPVCQSMAWVSTSSPYILSEHLPQAHHFDHELFGESVTLDETAAFEEALRLSMQAYLS